MSPMPARVTWLLSAVLPVEDVVPVSAGAFRRGQVQGVEACDVVLWRRGRNLDLPGERGKVFGFRVGGWH